MVGAIKVRNQGSSPYTSRGDFSRIFQKDMNRLYLLSFLLTTDSTLAEQCFVGGLHIAQEGNHVFKEWAEAWARRAIIQNAIRVVRPRRATHGTPSPDYNPGNALTRDREIAAISDLPPFERFVFVMSVLEHYSDQECSLLLGCTRGEVTAARIRALERMGRSSKLQRDVASIASKQTSQANKPDHAVQLDAFSSLAVSA